MNGPDTISAPTSSSDKSEKMNTVLQGTKSNRLRKDSDRMNAVNNAGKLPGTASVGVIGSGQLSWPTEFERRLGGAWQKCLSWPTGWQQPMAEHVRKVTLLAPHPPLRGTFSP